MPFEFEIPGKPIASVRPRFTAHPFPRVHPNPKAAKYQKAVALAARAAGVLVQAGPLAVTIHAYFEWPKSEQRKTKPKPRMVRWGRHEDVDNLAKNVLDGLIGIAYEDDNQVSNLEVWSLFTAQGGEAKACVRIEPIEVEPPA